MEKRKRNKNGNINSKKEKKKIKVKLKRNGARRLPTHRKPDKTERIHAH